MGSIRFDGVRFIAYPEDHEPRHVHGFYAETEVVIELRNVLQNEAVCANRWNAVRPSNASRSDVRHILQIAALHFDELVRLWEGAHA